MAGREMRRRGADARLVRADDRGVGTIETVGMLAVAAVLVVGIVVSLHPKPMTDMADTAICSVKTQTACAMPGDGATASTTSATGGSTTSPDNGDRRDQERQTRDDRRGRGGGDKAPKTPKTDGDDNGGGALGDPVSGTSVTEPKPPPWQPVDPGAGKYDSARAWPWDYAKKLAIETAANAMSGIWPDAARNMLHYLANTGQPLQQDVDRILHDVPQFAQEVDSTRTSLGESAVDKAKAAGATGPVTFPVNTNWTGYYITEDQNSNWFHALGGIQYNLTGQVTVYPPSSPTGTWRYVVTTHVNLVDQYNWDTGKSTNIGGLPITDKDMARLHLQGLAREYRNEGQSDASTTEGTVP